MQPIFQPVIPLTIGAKRVGIDTAFLALTLEIAQSKRLAITLLGVGTMDWRLSKDDWKPVRESIVLGVQGSKTYNARNTQRSSH